MPQIVVSEYAGDHGFTDGNGADSYTGVMAARCHYLGLLPRVVGGGICFMCLGDRGLVRARDGGMPGWFGRPGAGRGALGSPPDASWM